MISLAQQLTLSAVLFAIAVAVEPMLKPMNAADVTAAS